MSYELYKLFHRKMLLLFLAVCLLWAAAGTVLSAAQYEIYTEDMEPLRGFAAIAYDRDLQNTYAGRLAPDELKALWTECQEIYSDPSYRREAGSAPGKGNTSPLTDEAYWRYLNRFGMISTVGARTYVSPLYIDDARKSGDLTELYLDGIVLSPAEDALIPAADADSPIVQKLIGMYDSLAYPLYGEYFDGWIDFFNTVPLFFQWVVGLLIVAGLAPIFADETSTGCDKLLLTTKYGRTRLIRDKLLAALLYATAIFWTFVSAMFLTYIGCYGLSGLRASVQLLPHCPLSPYNLSIGDAIALWAMLGWLAALSAAAVTVFFSAAMKNAFTAVIPAFLAYILPSFGYAGLSPALHRATRLLPVNVIGNIDQLFSMADFYPFCGTLVERKVWIIAVSAVMIPAFSALAAAFFLRKEPSQ